MYGQHFIISGTPLSSDRASRYYRYCLCPVLANHDAAKYQRPDGTFIRLPFCRPPLSLSPLSLAARLEALDIIDRPPAGSMT